MRIAAVSGASGYHFLFKGFFTTAGMSVLWPLRDLFSRSVRPVGLQTIPSGLAFSYYPLMPVLLCRPTARFYSLITPMPACVPRAALLASFAPAALVNIWPWALVAHGDVNVVYGAFLWLFPWLGCGAIWTVMTQVSHAQADAQVR